MNRNVKAKKKALAGLNYFLSSKIRLGRKRSKISIVIQKGTINPRRNNNNQNAIPKIKRNKTIPKVLIIL
jgi:hypothetical protein